jgi:hypothetical protein
MPSEAALQELLDKQEIAEVLGARYARALDWLDLAELKTCFWDDGWVDYGFFEGNAHGWCDAVMPIESSSLHRFHYVFNIRVEVNGEHADAESNSLAGGRRENDDGALVQSFFGSRYLDKLERRDGIWKISERRTLLEFAQELPAGGGPGGGLKGLELITGLSPDHPLYRPMGYRKPG